MFFGECDITDREGRPTLIATLCLCNSENINPKNHIDAAFFAIEMFYLKVNNLMVEAESGDPSLIGQGNVIVYLSEIPYKGTLSGTGGGVTQTVNNLNNKSSTYINNSKSIG